ncbi:MAG: class B sortase [Oscillospiraceae bacterium]|nr:class B sortase [Oscillospiraceae bacterium]
MNTKVVVKRSVCVVNFLINLCVLIAIILLIAFGSYSIWDSGQVFSAASSANYATYRPTAEGEADSFADLQLINSDVFGWLTIFGTNIDYPVVQGQDNIRYVNTDAKGGHALSGAIFLDARSSPNFTDFSSIVYGHHMENNVMFGEIGLFSDRDYFDAHEHGMLYFEGKEHGLDFFAFVNADAYDTDIFRARITEQEEQQAYLEMLLDMAVHVRSDVSVTTNDRIVLFATCTSNATNGRDILIGKITDDIQNDPFWTETSNFIVEIPGIDGLSGQWVRISVGIIVFILIVLAIILICIKRKKG